MSSHARVSRFVGVLALVVGGSVGGSAAPVGTVASSRTAAATGVGIREPSPSVDRMALVRPRDLGTVPGAVGSTATAVNDRVQVVGTVYFGDGQNERHPFLWQNGVMRDLGSFEGLIAEAVDINNAGQVLIQGVTSVFGSLLGGKVHGYVWRSGQIQHIGTRDDIIEPVEINDRGEVLANRYTTPLVSRPVLWRSGKLVDLDLLPAGTSAHGWDLNERGDVLGSAVDAQGTSQPVVWFAGRPSPVLLGVPGGRSSAINDQGEVAMNVPGTAPHDLEAVLWKQDTIRDRAPMSSYATGINNHGVVTGSTPGTPEPDPLHAFTWSQGRVTVLPTPQGFLHTSALQINDQEQVRGVAVSAWEETRPVVWRQDRVSTLAPLPGDTMAWATDLNERGQVCGTSERINSGPGSQRHAVLWTVAPAGLRSGPSTRS